MTYRLLAVAESEVSDAASWYEAQAVVSVGSFSMNLNK